MDIQRFSRRLVELMPQLIRGFSRHEHNYLSLGHITLPQLWALECLGRREGIEGCPMNELAGLLGISRPACTGLIDRLIAQELVGREPDPGDRRIVRAVITPKGRKIVSNIWNQKRRMIVKVFGEIALKDRAQYLRTIEQVVRILKGSTSV